VNAWLADSTFIKIKRGHHKLTSGYATQLHHAPGEHLSVNYSRLNTKIRYALLAMKLPDAPSRALQTLISKASPSDGFQWSPITVTLTLTPMA
jgi:hypothetical protein